MNSRLSLLLAFTFCVAASAQTPAPANTFILSPDFPRYATAHVEVRDPSGTKWPSFFYGKPSASGTMVVDPAKPSASITLNCNERPQKQGDQSRRVLGQVFDSPEKGGMIVKVTTLSQVAAVASQPGVTSALFSGSIEMAGQTISFKDAPGSIRPNASGRGAEKDAMLFDFTFQSPPPDALKARSAEQLHFRVAATAYTGGPVSRTIPDRR